MNFRRPDFGDTTSYNKEAIVRRLMGGDVSVVTDPAWPNSVKLGYTISALSKNDRDNFIAFYAAVAGMEIIFTDMDNVQWRGYITSPSPQVTQEGRGCQFKTAFEFEGVKV